MPELPEIETTRRGITPHILGRRVTAVRVRERRLRRPVPRRLESDLPGQTVDAVDRRGKYLLLRMSLGTVILHLGMSGSLQVVSQGIAPRAHDHLDLVFDGGIALRLRDPRRFGLALWTRRDPLEHELLKTLGPEPLDTGFSAAYLHDISRGRRSTIKSLIMDAHMVAGVGNIYANEALFHAGIHPRRSAGRISAARFLRLVTSIRGVLTEAIGQGGTTLRDFFDGNGQPGYFGRKLAVYGREGEPCTRCASPIRHIRQGQRSSYYCPTCQH